MKKEKGITLIALVVTIVVLLILAGISIAMLTGENGVISQAKNAKEATEQAKVEELVTVAIGSVISKNNGSTAGITPKMVADQINEDEKRSDVYAENETTFPTNIVFPKEKRKAVANLNVKNTDDDTNQDEEEGKAVLMVCREYETTSPFLGNNSIQRQLVKSVKIQKSLDGHIKDDGSCWDVSEAQDGSILAWYTEEDVDGATAYNVTIGSNARIKANSNSSYLFTYIGYGINTETQIDGLNNLDTSNVVSMEGMFYCCKNLISLDLSGFNTGNVTNMYCMFRECSQITELDLSKFDTKSVIDMKELFAFCSNLISADVSNFNTSNVTNMSEMFWNCSKLTNLNVSAFNTSNVTNMYGMFCGCSKLTNIDISKFDTRNVTDISYMFSDCTKLTGLDVSNFNTGNVTNMRSMFWACEKLTDLNVSGFNTSNVNNMNAMFCYCTNLTELDVSNFNTGKVTDMSNMFWSCRKLTNLDVSGFDTRNVQNMSDMFEGCTALKELNLKNFNISKVTEYKKIFSNLPTDVKIYVSTDAMKTWVLEQNSSLTNFVVEP